jgi:hypothetical protein
MCKLKHIHPYSLLADSQTHETIPLNTVYQVMIKR